MLCQTSVVFQQKPAEIHVAYALPRYGSIRYRDRKSTRLNSSHTVISYAVDASCFYPPLTVLDEVAHEVRIALVEVRHGGNEPPIDGLAHVLLRGIGIEKIGRAHV